LRPRARADLEELPDREQSCRLEALGLLGIFGTGTMSSDSRDTAAASMSSPG